jgi:hypothetical protein
MKDNWTWLLPIIIVSMTIGIVSIVTLDRDTETIQVSTTQDIIIKKSLRLASEYGYFEGQKDALTGDIRIEKIYDTDSSYRWVKSPWDNVGVEPMYNPQDGMKVNADNMMKKVREERSTK